MTSTIALAAIGGGIALLVIAGEETLETSSVIRAMERYPGMALESVVRWRRR